MSETCVPQQVLLELRDLRQKSKCCLRITPCTRSACKLISDAVNNEHLRQKSLSDWVFPQADGQVKLQPLVRCMLQSDPPRSLGDVCVLTYWCVTLLFFFFCTNICTSFWIKHSDVCVSQLYHWRRMKWILRISNTVRGMCVCVCVSSAKFAIDLCETSRTEKLLF